MLQLLLRICDWEYVDEAVTNGCAVVLALCHVVQEPKARKREDTPRKPDETCELE